MSDATMSPITATKVLVILKVHSSFKSTAIETEIILCWTHCFSSVEVLLKARERVIASDIQWHCLTENSQLLLTEEKLDQDAKSSPKTAKFAGIPSFLLSFFSLWPVCASSELFTFLVDAVYRLLGTKAVLFSPSEGTVFPYLVVQNVSSCFVSSPLTFLCNELTSLIHPTSLSTSSGSPSPIAPKPHVHNRTDLRTLSASNFFTDLENMSIIS
jgi:hypothetical protein